MDWKKVIADLLDSGMTQVQIAAKCGVSQSSVSDLYRGASKKPSFEFGSKLMELHKPRRRRQAAAQEA